MNRGAWAVLFVRTVCADTEPDQSDAVSSASWRSLHPKSLHKSQWQSKALCTIGSSGNRQWTGVFLMLRRLGKSSSTPKETCYHAWCIHWAHTPIFISTKENLSSIFKIHCNSHPFWFNSSNSNSFNWRVYHTTLKLLLFISHIFLRQCTLPITKRPWASWHHFQILRPHIS